MNEDELARRIAKAEHLRSSRRYSEAIEEARRLRESCEGDVAVDSAAAALLIDSGGDMDVLEPVEEGIKLIESLLETEAVAGEARLSTGLRYNLANGFAAKYGYYRRRGDEVEASEAIQQEKRHLQAVLLDRRHLNAELLPRALTNYANLLDHLGRSFEAIDYYVECLGLAPGHPVALANSGVTMGRLIALSGRYKLHNLFAAHDHLSRGVEDTKGLVAEAGELVVEGLRLKLENVREDLDGRFEDGVDTLLGWSKHREEAHGSERPGRLMRHARDDRLLLSFNFFPLDSVEECCDDLFFSRLMTSIEADGETRFRQLAHSLNQIKEDFATARHLYYLSTSLDSESQDASSSTFYANALDYAVFGLEPGLLKAAFRIAVDSLDKMATFLNEYFELGLRADRVSFRNIWFRNLDGRQPEDERIGELVRKNIFLSALRDLRSDWFLEIYPGPFQGTRNAATHRRLVLHLEGCPPKEDTERWSISDFADMTKATLRTVKAAIQTLVAVVEVEEDRGEDGEALPMPFRLEPGPETY